MQLCGHRGHLAGRILPVIVELRFQGAHLVLQRLHLQAHGVGGRRHHGGGLRSQRRGDALLRDLEVLLQTVVALGELDDGAARVVKLGVELLERVAVGRLRAGRGGEPVAFHGERFETGRQGGKLGGALPTGGGLHLLGGGQLGLGIGEFSPGGSEFAVGLRALREGTVPLLDLGPESGRCILIARTGLLGGGERGLRFGELRTRRHQLAVGLAALGQAPAGFVQPRLKFRLGVAVLGLGLQRGRQRGLGLRKLGAVAVQRRVRACGKFLILRVEFRTALRQRRIRLLQPARIFGRDTQRVFDRHDVGRGFGALLQGTRGLVELGLGGGERRPVGGLRLLRRPELRLEVRQLGADGDQFAIGLFALSQAAVGFVEPRLKFRLGVAVPGLGLQRGRQRGFGLGELGAFAVQRRVCTGGKF